MKKFDKILEEAKKDMKPKLKAKIDEAVEEAISGKKEEPKKTVTKKKVSNGSKAKPKPKKKNGGKRPGAGAPKGNKNAVGNNGGRPTKFKPEYCEKIVEFFDIEPFIRELAEKSKEYFKDGGVKKESEKYRFTPNKMPTLYRFAKEIGVSYHTVYMWAIKGEFVNEEDLELIKKDTIKGKELKVKLIEFSNSYKEAKELQKEFLINLGLAGVAPSAFAIFTAKNVTDMRDKQEVELSGRTLGDLFNNVPNKNRTDTLESETGGDTEVPVSDKN